MAKVNEYVVDALEDLVVQADEAPIEASEARACIRVLNDMMTMFAANGINLGYTVVSDLGDDVTIPDGAIMGVKAHLAIMLADKYEVDVSARLQWKADQGMRAMLNLAVETTASKYPSTLPRGSGNSYPGFRSSAYPFYPDEESTILEETGGSIALEDDTEAAS